MRTTSLLPCIPPPLRIPLFLLHCRPPPLRIPHFAATLQTTAIADTPLFCYFADHRRCGPTYSKSPCARLSIFAVRRVPHTAVADHNHRRCGPTTAVADPTPRCCGSHPRLCVRAVRVPIASQHPAATTDLSLPTPPFTHRDWAPLSFLPAPPHLSLTASFLAHLLPGCGPREGRSMLRVPVWSTQASTTAQIEHAVAPIGRAPHQRAQEAQARLLPPAPWADDVSVRFTESPGIVQAWSMDSTWFIDSSLLTSFVPYRDQREHVLCTTTSCAEFPEGATPPATARSLDAIDASSHRSPQATSIVLHAPRKGYAQIHAASDAEGTLVVFVVLLAASDVMPTPREGYAQMHVSDLMLVPRESYGQKQLPKERWLRKGSSSDEPEEPQVTMRVPTNTVLVQTSITAPIVLAPRESWRPDGSSCNTPQAQSYAANDTRVDMHAATDIVVTPNKDITLMFTPREGLAAPREGSPHAANMMVRFTPREGPAALREVSPHVHHWTPS